MFYEVGMLDQFVVANKCVEVGYTSTKSCFFSKALVNAVTGEVDFEIGG